MALTLAALISLGVPWVKEENAHFIFYIFPLFRWIDFSLGILNFDLWDRSQKTLKSSSLNFTLLEVLSILILALFITGHDSVPKTYTYSSYYWLPMGVILFVFAFQKDQISKCLSHRFFLTLGKISFGFYMLHQLLIRYFASINERFQIIDNQYVIFVFLLMSSLFLSYFSLKFIEEPCNLWIKRYFSRKKTLKI